jgi:hypothetical protein
VEREVEPRTGETGNVLGSIGSGRERRGRGERKRFVERRERRRVERESRGREEEKARSDPRGEGFRREVLHARAH